MTSKVLFSLDVEEFDIPEEYGQKVDDRVKVGLSAEGLTLLLDLLEELDVNVTCFTTVFFARSRPDLVGRIIGRHELASHGVLHSAEDGVAAVRAARLVHEPIDEHAGDDQDDGEEPNLGGGREPTHYRLLKVPGGRRAVELRPTRNFAMRKTSPCALSSP